MPYLPELMKLNNGSQVTDAAAMRLRRTELLHILQENAYGAFPARVPVTGRIVNDSARCCSGNAHDLSVEITCRFDGGDFTFPLRLFIPNGEDKKPLIFVINFRPSPYDEYIPVEEILDNGFALAHIYYGDITEDNNDFTSKIAAFFPRNGASAPGKISMWAWAVSRALDHVLTMDLPIDVSRIGVIGHSRLGKTALWCGANDERFSFVCSNDSGCMGAAYARTYHEGGEPVASIATVFPYWFCERFQQYRDDVGNIPFDQHFLLAAIAPRAVLVNSASKDAWADPVSEQNACIAASPAWNVYQKDGYLGEEAPYGENNGSLQGNVGYYKRYGIHFLGRKDWQNFIAFIRNK